MCTALSFKTKDHYFGRTLDIDRSYGEYIIVTPRHYSFDFKNVPAMKTHYALIGTGAKSENYPLYYEATNEAGLSMAGLNFPGNADYKKVDKAFTNISPFEFIPWVLGQCASVKMARRLMENLRIVNVPLCPGGMLSPLHWMIADRDEAIVVEAMKDGLHVYDNPVGVMTNNPPFDKHLSNLNNYLHLTAEQPENHFSKDLNLSTYCLGMGSIGLPGDPSSMSRFVKAAFVRENSVCGESESESVSQFFHIMNAVFQPRGISHIEGDRYEYTLYTCCCNATRGIYYYKTYENTQITAVDMHREDLDADLPIFYPMQTKQQVILQN